MSIIPRFVDGGVWIPNSYLLMYPFYFTAILVTMSTGSDIMNDLIEFIGNTEILVSAAIAFVVTTFVIYFMLRNEYASTRKKKYAEQLSALRAGGEVDQLVLDQYAQFDRAYTLTMIPAILFGTVLTVITIIGLSLVWTPFSEMAVDIVAAFVISTVFGLVFEKGAQACADGTVTEKYTDKILKKINEVRKVVAPDSDEKATEIPDAVRQLADLLTKIGKN